jgi:spore coat polysaccharide biosynthesis protein SpsF
MRIVAIIQARMGSTRLPGKVLQDLAGEPMLARVVNRTCRATTLQEVVIATTTSALDDAIVKLCKARDWSWFRGSEEDVLDRYYRAAKEYQADLIVRITSDCPLIDPEVIDQVVKAFLERQPEVDYASNTWPRRTFPRGLDTEVMRIDVLERAWREDSNPAWREHVTPYIYRNPDRFRIHNVLSQVDYSAMRWTVDATEDLTFVRQIYDYFDHDGFSWHEVLKVLEEHPEWLEINRHIQQKVI